MPDDKNGNQRGMLGVAALLALAGGNAAAESLPPLRVDPALLGAPPLPPTRLPATAAPATPTPEPVTAETAPVVPATGVAAPASPVPADAPSTATDPAAPVAVRSVTAPGGAALETPLRAAPGVEAGSQAASAKGAAAGTASVLPEPRLKSAGSLAELPKDSQDPHPVFVSAERMHGVNDNEIVAEGNVQFRQFGTTLDADRITYWQAEDEAEAEGNVRLAREGDSMAGPKLRLKLKDSVGFFDQPKYSFRRTRSVTPTEDTTAAIPGLPVQAEPVTRTTTASGEAERLSFEGKDHYRLSNATYSTCKPGPDGKPDWWSDVADLSLDYERQVGVAHGAHIKFRGVPLLYLPYASFALNNQRKSGFLTPTIGSSSKSGFELTTPYYLNIAPDMDATLSPRLMTRRGLQLNGEFRYLEPTYSGAAQVEYLANDRVTGTRRSGYTLTHNQSFAPGLTGNLNLNGVSDDTYFTDLSTRIANTSQGNLLRQGTLSYGAAWWSATAVVQRYQTLQDPSLPTVAVPYRRLPQLTLAANRADLPLGSVFGFAAEYVDFSHPIQDTGRRTTLYPQLSLPIQTAAFTVTPKLGLNVTRYTLDRRVSTGPESITRNVPIFSVDGAVTFERSTEWQGRSLTQTLEPRLYYLYVPNRDQSQIPVFDTGLADFTFAQIFSENRYSGGDRIADANQLTAAVTSRLIDPATGAEVMRGALGQRFYFSTQNVALPGEVARSTRKTDLLAALSGPIWAKTYFDAGWQYNQNERRTERLNLGGRYQPEVGKVVNAGYRYSRDLLGQIDLSAQWPLSGAWHGVGRYNYSTKDHRLIESIGGLEYDGGCWVARFVVQRVATAIAAANTAIFVQLELNDFSRIGSNPLDMLKRSIPGYGRINDSTADPAFGAQ